MPNSRVRLLPDEVGCDVRMLSSYEVFLLYNGLFDERPILLEEELECAWWSGEENVQWC